MNERQQSRMVPVVSPKQKGLCSKGIRGTCVWMCLKRTGGESQQIFPFLVYATLKKKKPLPVKRDGNDDTLNKLLH